MTACSGAGNRFAVPLLHGDTLYLPTCSAGALSEGQIEAWRILP